MNRDDIIRMAREAGGTEKYVPSVWQFFSDELERFANLVAIHATAKEREWMQDINKRLIAEAVAAEREACAKVCARYIDSTNDSVALTALNIHDAIRARGEQ